MFFTRAIKSHYKHKWQKHRKETIAKERKRKMKNKHIHTLICLHVVVIYRRIYNILWS